MGRKLIENRNDAIDTWDPIVDELVQIVAALARLHAAATGEPKIVANLQEGCACVARAAAIALPFSSYGKTPAS